MRDISELVDSTSNILLRHKAMPIDVVNHIEMLLRELMRRDALLRVEAASK